MPLIVIMGIMFALSLMFPRATKALIVAPILGLVLGAVGWSAIAILDRSFNTFPFFLTSVGVATLLVEIIVHWDELTSG